MQINIFQPIGQATFGLLRTAGRIVLFAMSALYHAVTPPFYPRQMMHQMIEIGYFSLPVVALTTLFAGMVIALQTFTGVSRFDAEATVPQVVVLAITRELAPVLAGLMVAGRIGTSLAAEIGTMRVTQQIDALSTLSTNPMKYLVAPRIVSGVLMLAALLVVGDVIGVLGGYLMAITKLDFNGATYLQKTLEFVTFQDVFSGIVKAAVFGFIITLMGCYHGYHSTGGAQGVGRATINAMVSAAILILFFDLLLTEIFFVK